MRFLIDESVGIDVTLYLRSVGHDVRAIAELAPQTSDSDILAWAVQEQRIVITINKDFGELVFRSGQAHRGVILFRLRDENAANQVQLLAAAVSQYASHLSGRFTVISETGVRIR
jgi:predicted nuclease of predicted toxin-antitoxin system